MITFFVHWVTACALAIAFKKNYISNSNYQQQQEVIENNIDWQKQQQQQHFFHKSRSVF